MAYRKAQVRFLVDYECRSVQPNLLRRYHKGQVETMFQWTRGAELPNEYSAWWDSFDIDGAHIIPNSLVLVEQILSEVMGED